MGRINHTKRSYYRILFLSCNLILLNLVGLHKNCYTGRQHLSKPGKYYTAACGDLGSVEEMSLRPTRSHGTAVYSSGSDTPLLEEKFTKEYNILNASQNPTYWH